MTPDRERFYYQQVLQVTPSHFTPCYLRLSQCCFHVYILSLDTVKRLWQFSSLFCFLAILKASFVVLLSYFAQLFNMEDLKQKHNIKPANEKKKEEKKKKKERKKEREKKTHSHTNKQKTNQKATKQEQSKNKTVQALLGQHMLPFPQCFKFIAFSFP